MSVAARCLVVDDEPQVRRVLARVMEGLGLPCAEAANGAEALAWLEREGSVPVIISDINMPELDGFGLLDEVRRRWPDTAVLMLTAVADVQGAVRCLTAGAMDYMAKPVMVDEVRTRVERALERRELVLQNRYYQQNLEQRVRQQAGRIREVFLKAVQALAAALDAKDPYTRGHSARVSDYAVRTAVVLGYTGDALEEIRIGGELHDIGKIDTPESVLNKPGPLTPEEFDRIMRHTVLGERILEPLLNENPTILRIVRSHHEHLDGTGRPDGLSGEAIDPAVRIVSVADAYDAMTTARAYRQQLESAEAIAELRRCAGSHFDPDTVEAFILAMERQGG